VNNGDGKENKMEGNAEIGKIRICDFRFVIVVYFLFRLILRFILLLILVCL